MESVYGIHRNRTTISILEIKQFDDILIINNFATVSDLSDFSFDKKKKINFSCDQEYIINEDIPVPSSIKSKSGIKNYITYFLKKKKPNIDPLFSFHVAESQDDDDNTIYHTSGVDNSSYSSSFEIFESLDQINNATLLKESILAISIKCISHKNFISIYSLDNSLLILAIQNNKIIFSRNIDSSEHDISTDINQTVTYVNQQFRSIQFEIIALSGEISNNIDIPEQLIMMNSLPVATLNPLSFTKNISGEDVNFHIPALGCFLIEESQNIFPKAILAKKQFSFLVKIISYFAVFVLATIFVITLLKYNSYSDTLDKHSDIKSQFKTLVKKTHLLPNSILNKSLLHLDVVKKYLKHNPADTIIKFKNIITELKPDRWEWIYEEKEFPKFRTRFKKKFSSLSDLYFFEHSFSNKINDINTLKAYLYKTNINHKQLIFEATIENAKIEEAVNDIIPMGAP